MTYPRVTKSLLFALLGLVTACGSDSTDVNVPDPALAIASGNGQTAAVGATLSNPIAVRVTQSGAAVPGVSVSWSVVSGGGSVNPATSTTGADGQATTMWTLGGAAGANSVQASASGVTGSPQTFTATGTSGTPPATASVTVNDNTFDPSSVTIAVGGSVTWTWAGSASHNVTFSAGTNSPTQTAGSFARTFASAGTFNYQCSIHGAAMAGTVIVQ